MYMYLTINSPEQHVSKFRYLFNPSNFGMGDSNEVPFSPQNLFLYGPTTLRKQV